MRSRLSRRKRVDWTVGVSLKIHWISVVDEGSQYYGVLEHNVVDNEMNDRHVYDSVGVVDYLRMSRVGSRSWLFAYCI